MWTFGPWSGAFVVGAPEVQVVKAIKAARATTPERVRRRWAGRAAATLARAARGKWVRLERRCFIVNLPRTGFGGLTEDLRSVSRAQFRDRPRRDRYGER